MTPRATVFDSPRHAPFGAVAARIVEEVLRAVDPSVGVGRALHCSNAELRVGPHAFALRPHSRVWLLCVGKASVAMARAAVQRLGPRLTGGLVITKHEPAEPLEPQGRLRVLTTRHPIPDASSVAAGHAALALARAATVDDVLVVALSGGASSLMVAPRDGVSLSELQALGTLLLRSGQPIEVVNRQRARLDMLKAGGLARAAAPCRVATLVLSDVVEAPLSVVGSGPTEGTPLVKLADNTTAVQAAIETARGLGFHTERWPTVRGEAQALGASLGQRLREARPAGPTIFVAGGESTVTVRGTGRGGRNQELALAAAQSLAGPPRALMTFATDGEDGPTDAAGAMIDTTTVARAQAQGLQLPAALQNNDSYRVLDALHDLIRTGPTGTNVCDLVVAFAQP